MIAAYEQYVLDTIETKKRQSGILSLMYTMQYRKNGEPERHRVKASWDVSDVKVSWDVPDAQIKRILHSAAVSVVNHWERLAVRAIERVGSPTQQTPRLPYYLSRFGGTQHKHGFVFVSSYVEHPVYFGDLTVAYWGEPVRVEAKREGLVIISELTFGPVLENK